MGIIALLPRTGRLIYINILLHKNRELATNITQIWSIQSGSIICMTIFQMIYLLLGMGITVSMILSFAGGVALFLLGMKLLTDGLKIAAGDSLRNLLSRYTSGIARGIASGILVTALVQSSSAVIFATIGFVNAGVLGLGQAIYVIFGSNVGTTFTGWIIASVGLKIDLQLLAMPLITVGMALWLLKGNRSAAWGQAMTGLSLFFMGIDLLKDTFIGFGDAMPLELVSDGILGTLQMAFIGIFLTTVMQSSSAAIAVIITAAAGGVIPVQMAAVMVIGADIGTTSTAVFAVIGATSNAKRTASAHVLFNVIGGVLVLFLVPVYLQAIDFIFGASLSVGVTIALFHTLKKITSLIIMLPMVPALESYLNKRFIDRESIHVKPKFLDNTVLETPSLAVSALIFELKRIGRKSRSIVYNAAWPQRDISGLDRQRQGLEKIHYATAEFIQKMQRSGFPKDQESVLPQALRVLEYFREAVQSSMEIAMMREAANQLPGHLNSTILAIRDDIQQLCRIADSELDQFDIAKVLKLQVQILEDYESFKSALLISAAQGEIQVPVMLQLHDKIRNYKYITDQLVKAAVYMDDFNKLIRHEPADQSPVEAILELP